jgi:phospholipase/carboxylesterase
LPPAFISPEAIMSDYLPAIEIETAPHPTYAVIWLHGLGADGNDFVSIVPELGLPPMPAVRFVFPHAPRRPITINNGFVMRGWYDVASLDDNRDTDMAGIEESAAAVRRLIERENARGIPCERIVLAGFSQGGAMAYTTGLTHPKKLAGIMALSAYIPAPALLFDSLSDANRRTPIFAAHGVQDDILPIALGEAACRALQQHGFEVEWHSYPMPHAVCLPEIVAIGAWLAQRLPQ